MSEPSAGEGSPRAGTYRDSRPLTLVMIGLVLAFGDLNVAGIDMLPDPLGWVIAAFGLNPLRGRHHLLDVAFWAAVALVPFSVVGYAVTDGAAGRAVAIVGILLASVFLVPLMLAVRALTPVGSTHRVATVVVVVDVVLTVAALLAQLLVAETVRDVDLGGAAGAAAVALVLAALAVLVAFFVWLYRVGEQEPFRA